MIDRKEAIREYKQRKPQRGVYAIRCLQTGSVWVGFCHDVTAARNRNWFLLRQRLHTDRAMQQEWDLHGAAQFQYEVLEKLDEDLPLLSVADALKGRRSAWLARMEAAAGRTCGRVGLLL